MADNSRLTLLMDTNKIVVPVFSRILTTDPGTIELRPTEVVDRAGTVSGDDLTLRKGESVTREYILRRVKYDGPVSLAIDKNTTAITVVAPVELTGTSQRTLISEGISEQRFSVTITMNANAVGSQIYPFTIRANAQDTKVPVATTTTQVVAQDALQRSIGASASPATITLASNTNGTSTITVTRTNFAENVKLTVSVPPNRGTALFAGSQPTVVLSSATPTATLTITAPNVTTATEYPVTIRAEDPATSPAVSPVSTTITVTAQPKTLAIDANNVTIQKAVSGPASNNTPLTITKSANVTDAVVVTVVSGVPTNVSAAVNATNTNLTFTAQSSAVAGNYSITIRATAGSLVAEKVITLQITDGPPPPSYVISATTPINIQKSSLQTTTAASTISITRTNFTENVTLGTPIVRNSSNGTPTGLTVSLSSQTIVGLGTSTATITVAASVPLGTYTIQIPSTSGTLTSTATITVNITQVSEWVECSTGNRRTDSIPTNYVSSTRPDGQVCYEPASQLGFSGNLNFSFRRGTSQFATGETRTVTATNPSSTKAYQVALTTNPNITITPSSFRIERSGTATFTVRITPQLLTALPDSPANVLNINAQITEV